MQDAKLGTMTTQAISISPTMQQKIIAAMRRAFPALERAFIRDLLKAFRELGADIARLYLKEVRPGSTRATPPNPEDSIIINRILQRVLFDRSRIRQAYTANMGRTLTMTQGNLTTLLGLRFNIPDERAREIIRLGGQHLGLIDIEGETRDALFRAFDEGRILGEGPDAIARRIRSEVPAGRFRHAGAEYRAKLIARTETAVAQNTSSLEAYDSVDIFQSRKVFDGTDDEECRNANGQLWSPGYAKANMIQHPNCVRAFAPSVEEPQVV